MLRFIKKHLIDIFWAFCIVISISFLSIIWIQYLLNGKCNSHLFFNLASSILIPASVLIWFSCRANILSRLRGKKTKLSSEWIDIIALVVFAVLIIMLIRMSINYLKVDIHWEFFRDNIGGIFAILMGVATVVGTYLAIKSIRDANQIITSYSELMERLIELLEDSKNCEIRIVSYFVLPGFWQVKNKNQTDRLRELLDEKSSNIRIATLTRTEHLSILIDMAKFSTPRYPNRIVPYDAIKNYLNYSEKIIINTKNYYPLENDKLPYYYFFVSNKKAIIVTPVGLPIVKNDAIESIRNATIDIFGGLNIKVTTTEYDDIQANKAPRYVKDFHEGILNNPEFYNEVGNPRGSNIENIKIDTLGFETSNQRIIDMLWDKFTDIVGVDPEQ